LANNNNLLWSEALVDPAGIGDGEEGVGVRIDTLRAVVVLVVVHISNRLILVRTCWPTIGRELRQQQHIKTS